MGQESWEAARGAGSVAGSQGGGLWLRLCWVIGVLECLGCVLVQLKKRLTFRMPSPSTMSIPDSADLNHNLACLPSMRRGSGALTLLPGGLVLV
jgi:hypothetical protein